MQIRKPVWDRVWDQVSASLNTCSSFEKWIIETNNETNIAIINFKLLFYGVRLAWLTTVKSLMI